jgi:ankyrin repeat protein
MLFRDYKRDMHFLPEEFQLLFDELIRLEGESGVIDDLSIRLPADEVKQFLDYVKANNGNPEELKKLQQKIASTIKPTQPLLENLYLIRDIFVAHQRKNNDSLVKSARFDDWCFIYSLSESITPIQNVPKVKKPLRQGPHLGYTVYAAGVFPREKGKKPTPYKLSPEETAKRKSALSTHQSTSLVTPAVQSPVFGHNRSRKDVLVGYIFDATHALLNRMYIYDGGTFGRPYEFNREDDAKRYHAHVTNPREPILFDDIEKFKMQLANVINREKYNEVMARIGWLPVSSSVAIFNNNFPSRCVAQFYARVEKRYLKAKLIAEKLPWDESYRLPIMHYEPGTATHWEPYTHEAQVKDEKAAYELLSDPEKLTKAINENDTQFLLLISPRDWLANEMAVKYVKGEIMPTIQPQLRYGLLWRYVMEENPEKIDAKLMGDFLNEADADYFLINGGDLTVFEFALKNNLFKKDIRWDSFINEAVEKNRLIELDLVFRYSKNLNIIWGDIAKQKLPDTLVLSLLPRLTENEKMDLLFNAIMQGRTNLLEIFFEQEDFSKLLRVWTLNGETPLIWAVRTGKLSLVKKILAHPDPAVRQANAKDRDGKTALMHAVDIRGESAWGKGQEMIDTLLSNPDVDPNTMNDHGDTYVSLVIKKIIDGNLPKKRFDDLLTGLKRSDPQINFGQVLLFIFDLPIPLNEDSRMIRQQLDDFAVRILQTFPALLKGGGNFDPNKIFIKACKAHATRSALVALLHADFNPDTLTSSVTYSAKHVLEMAALYQNVDFAIAFAAKFECPGPSLDLKFYQELNANSTNALSDYLLATFKYLKSLDARQVNYQPRFMPNFLPHIPLENIRLGGYSKEQKKAAVMRFLNTIILDRETPDHPFVKPEDLPVLQNGKFNADIYSKLPANLKEKLERRVEAGVKLKK